MINLKKMRHQFTKAPLLGQGISRLQHVGLRHADVFVASYPRSGSTWLRFMLYEALCKHESSFKEVDRTIIGVGRHYQAPRILPAGGRLLQTHQPFRLEYTKAVYLVRDVRDVVLSEYNFMRRLHFFDGSFDDFFGSFILGKANRYGFWGENVGSWHRAYQNDLANILWLRFEDMRSNPTMILADVLNFLDVERTEREIVEIVRNHSINRMKKKEEASPKFADNTPGIPFIGDGSVGKWESGLSAEQLTMLESRVGDLLDELGYEEHRNTQPSGN